jgi:DNA-binding GntR family transcriptional regulator
MNPIGRGSAGALDQVKQAPETTNDLTEVLEPLAEGLLAGDAEALRKSADAGNVRISDPGMHVSGDRTLAERAYAAIHGAIVSGEFEPGDRLRIEDLSATLGISPTPIREALNRLEAAGLAERVPHRGSRVTATSPGDLRELYEARLALEPLAVAKSAERFTAETANAARACLARFNDATDRNDAAEARRTHAAFHFLLYGASDSRWLVRLITPLWESSQRYRTRWKTLAENPARCDREHERILAACEAHQAAVAAIELYNHLARHANQIAVDLTGKEFFELKDLRAPASPSIE